MNFVRWFLGRLVLGHDLLIRPARMKRDPVDQAKLDTETAKFVLYQFNACPFCVKVRRELRRYALNIELRDARNDEKHKAELIRGGGRHKVPCLQVKTESGGVTWLYESSEIISYLKSELKLV
jgi:glutaredoxin